MPYCLQPLAEGGYLPLNRSYKPLGKSGEWVDYEQAPAYARLNITCEQANRLDHTGQSDPGGQVFLYDDATSPWHSDDLWEAYLGRLTLLAQMVENHRRR